jgi:hypothetical protein
VLDAKPPIAHVQTVYALTEAIVLTDRGFAFAPGGGERRHPASIGLSPAAT